VFPGLPAVPLSVDVLLLVLFFSSCFFAVLSSEAVLPSCMVPLVDRAAPDCVLVCEPADGTPELDCELFGALMSFCAEPPAALCPEELL
jgi:hypothetical protein